MRSKTNHRLRVSPSDRRQNLLEVEFPIADIVERQSTGDHLGSHRFPTRRPEELRRDSAVAEEFTHEGINADSALDAPAPRISTLQRFSGLWFDVTARCTPATPPDPRGGSPAARGTLLSAACPANGVVGLSLPAEFDVREPSAAFGGM
jgi:hypothetical protein